MADLAITTNQVQPGDGTFAVGIASGAIGAGAPVYVRADGDIGLCDADNTQTTATCAGVSVCEAFSGQKIVYQTTGTITLGAAATVIEGEIYLTSDTAGKIRPAADVDAGDWVSVLGVGNADDGIDLRIFNSGIQHA